MRLDFILHLYGLNALWGAGADPQACRSIPSVFSPVICAVAKAPPSEVTAFIDVNVVPMDIEQVLPHQTVLVEAGRIIALGATDKVTVPAGAMRIDGRGKFLLPGLADMHVHIGSIGSKTEPALLQWLAQGITTVRNMDFLAQSPKGRQALLQLRAQAAAGELWSPRIYTAGHWTGSRVKASWFTSQSATFDAQISNAIWKGIEPESVATYITEYRDAGYDFIKSHDETAEIFDSVLAVAHRLGIPVGGHVPIQVPLEHAIAGGIKSIEHHTGSFWGRGVGVAGRDTSAAYLHALADTMRRAGVWSTPTLIISGSPYPPKRSKNMVMGRFVKALQDAGAGLLLGTDNRPLVRELEAFTSWGLTPYEALVTGTRNVAEFLGTMDETGTIAVGKRADLVLLTGNPLHDIHYTAWPAGVMIGGRWLAREEISRELEQEKHWPSSQAQLDWDFAERASRAFLDEMTLSAAQDTTLRKHRLSHRAQRRALTDSLGPLRVDMDGQRRRQRTLALFVRQLENIRAVLTLEQQAMFDSRVLVWRQNGGRWR